MVVHLNKAESLNPLNKKDVDKMRDDTWYSTAAAADTIMNEVPKMETEAKASFASALEYYKGDYPDSAAKFINMTKAKMKIREKDPAEEPYNLAIDKAKIKEFDEANKNFDLAMNAAARNSYETARNKFEMAILINPGKPEAYAKTAFAWFNLKNDDSSFYYYNEAHRLAPANLEVLRNLARIAVKIGKSDLVDSLYAKILESDPSNAEALVRRGDIAEQRGEFEKAADFYSKALEISPDQCEIWFSLGVIYFRELKKIENAEQAFARAVDLCPQDINAFINLNVILISQNKLDEAIERLNTFTEKNPDDCTGWDLLSQALLRKGQKEQALAANRKYENCKQKK
jgi:tetratricopeptide (TPR) repeat protein